MNNGRENRNHGNQKESEEGQQEETLSRPIRNTGNGGRQKRPPSFLRESNSVGLCGCD